MSFTTEYVKEKAAKIVIKSAQGDLSVEFPAFLTSFTNSFSSNWNEEQVYGRQDPIGTFQSTTRTINIGFDIVSFDIETAKENMEKIKQEILHIAKDHNKLAICVIGAMIILAIL